MDKILSVSTIRRRITSLANERDDLELRLSEIVDEIDDLTDLERMVSRYGVDYDDPDGSSEPSPDEATLPFPADTNAPPRAKTNKEAILLALKIASDVWLTANELQERAGKLKAKHIPMATISPTLSNLKNDGVIVRDGLKVALASRLNENGAANGLPQTAPETALAAQ